jgi:hypothetical protein
MGDIKVKAEVFKVVRTNMDKPKSVVFKIIKARLPAEPMERIAKALKELLGRYK